MRLVCAALLLAATTFSALAQRGPEIVIPGRPGVPVYINGVDASWGIIEGDFGLDRPGMASPTIVYLPYPPKPSKRMPAYYPADGRRPGYGRLEIVPPRNHVLPPPAQPYFREWSSSSDTGPVTDYPRDLPMLIAPTITPNLGNQGGRPHPKRSTRNNEHR
jgi:hypothetical protein